MFQLILIDFNQFGRCFCRFMITPQSGIIERSQILDTVTFAFNSGGRAGRRGWSFYAGDYL